MSRGAERAARPGDMPPSSSSEEEEEEEEEEEVRKCCYLTLVIRAVLCLQF